MYYYRNKVDIHSKRADLAKEKLVEVMRCYEQKTETQAIDLQRLQEICNRFKCEQNDCKTMHQQPELMIEKLKKFQKYEFLFLPIARQIVCRFDRFLGVS